jgi:hypothetical protein
MSDYDTDILEWSERQAALLRRLSGGEAVNAEIDWPNLIEEVEDVGRNTLRACRAQLLQALLHDLKAEAWPLSRDVPHWRSEARVAAHQRRGRLRAVHAPEDRRGGYLRQGVARHAGDNGWPAAAAGAGCVPGDAG